MMRELEAREGQPRRGRDGARAEGQPGAARHADNRGRDGQHHSAAKAKPGNRNHRPDGNRNDGQRTSGPRNAGGQTKLKRSGQSQA